MQAVYCPHFTDAETETEPGQHTQSCTASRWGEPGVTKTGYLVSPCAKLNGHIQATGLGLCGPGNPDLKTFSCVRGNTTPQERGQIWLGENGYPVVEVLRRERLERIQNSFVEKVAFELDLG